MFFEVNGHAGFHGAVQFLIEGSVLAMGIEIPHVLAKNFRARNPAQVSGFVIDVSTAPLLVKSGEPVP